MPQEPFLFILLLLTLFSFLAAAAAAILAARAGNGKSDMDGLYNALDRQRTALSEEARQTRQESSRAAMEAAEALGRTLASGQQQQSRELSIRQDSLQRTVAELTRGMDARFAQFMAQNEQQLSGIRSTVENRLSAMQEDNAAKLEQMRKTVDERLEKTLETRLGQSFKLVSERLEQVYKGLGEMQTLAAGVGDLKKVLSNVKTRGLLGEVQLGAILEDILAPGQYETNVATRRDSRNPVEFAVVLPGDGETPVYLPIDAKFPADAYIQLTQAYELGGREAVDEASKLLKARIKAFARDIRDKYIDPPHTTDFAVMFLPFEGLYAQVLQLDLVEPLQRDYKVVVAGPATMAALLNSLHMGFKTLAIQKRSAEVWQVLGAVKTEFNRFGDVLETTQQRLEQAGSELDKLVGVRTRAIRRRLAQVGELPETDAANLLGGEE
ncbi:DNA recombination protein RmuC [Anaerotruncus colihominis]|uniref:DNA recombination protein RmuC n=1 Tax=Anaerotruncus colihominis TaxID=169435 RepID=UPI003513A644